MTEFQVRKAYLATYRLRESDAAQTAVRLPAGAIRARVERFSFTANNITYAVVGEQLGYWQFFPPGGDDAEGWGIIPAWGFAEVTESNCASLPVGDRLFGYFPTATHLDMTPTHVSEQRFVDGSAHRAGLPSGYNSYTRVNAEPGYDRSTDDLRMLLWPLHITSFCLWDALRDKSWFGAEQVVILSASSKTSIGLAQALHDDPAAPAAIAVTSEQNRGFVAGLDLYEKCFSYGSVTDIDAGVPAVIVDMSGNGEVLGRLHRHLGENMKRCINVGLTHWDETQAGEGVVAERSEFFFAPSHIQKRLQDWGPDEFGKKTSDFIQRTAARSRDWLTLRKIDGLQGLADVYDAVREGRVAANLGLIVELQARPNSP